MKYSSKCLIGYLNSKLLSKILPNRSKDLILSYEILKDFPTSGKSYRSYKFLEILS